MLAGNVLVVEDSVTVGRQIVAMLDQMGHSARLLDSAEKGLEVFGKRSFDVVLSDVSLPGIDGIEMIRRMRAVDPLVTPIVMTAREDQETAVRALECGIQIFLRKPIQREVLRERLQEALRSRQRETERRSLFADLLRMRAELQETVVTQHRRLALTEGYLNDLLDAAPFAIVSTDREDRVLTLNSTAQRLYQRSEVEALGRNVAELFGDAAWEAGGRCQHVRPDGTRFPVLVRRRRILDDSRQHIAQLYVIEDLSESETLREQLLYAERLSVLGQMAPRIAHEFKTPLQLIAGFTELALIHVDNGTLAEAKESLQSVLPAVQELAQLVQQIANLGRPRQSAVEALDLRAEVEKVLQPMAQLGVVKHCQVEKDFATDLPVFRGDSTQVEQVFRNLIVNAVHAMEGCPRRVLRLAVRPSEAGDQIICTVEDSGTGIPPEDLERVFEPFYTTKKQGRGTGLGLPIVRSVLDRYGATLRVESEVGRGTRFEICFPLGGGRGAV